jgi:hypothetical protein
MYIEFDYALTGKVISGIEAGRKVSYGIANAALIAAQSGHPAAVKT